MAERRFGPVLDAGTVIVEKEAEKTIRASALGSTGYVGVLERGEVGALTSCTSKRDMLAKVGELIPDSVLPDCAQDFWSHGEGAGSLHLVRATDGSEVKSSATLYNRASVRQPVVRVDAKSGGSWGGKRDVVVLDLTAVPGDITATVITLPLGYIVPKNKWAGGTLTLSGAAKSYKIVSNTKGTASVRATVTLAADATALADFGASTDKEIILALTQVDVWARKRGLAVVVKDGQINPATEWGMEVWLHGELVRSYPDLSSDPLSSRYFVRSINDDGSNHYIAVTDLWTGAVVAATRPANHYGSLAAAKASGDDVNIDTACVLVNAASAGDNTIGSFTFGAQVIPDTYTLTYVAAGPHWTVASSKQAGHTFPNATGGVAYPADNAYGIGFTITELTPVNGEQFVVTVLPLQEDEAIGGRLYLVGVAGAAAAGYRVRDNAETTVEVATADITLGGTLPNPFNYRMEYQQELTGGYDGIAELDAEDLRQHYDPDSSPFNRLKGGGYGLVKLATPGVTLYAGVDETTVEKQGVAYAAAKNYQYRYEIPKATTDETAAKVLVQDTLGKSDYARVIFPSWASVSDPVLAGRLKDIPVTGMVHGREAKVARDYLGYHKVAAGQDVTLPRIKSIPTGTVVLNGELLNPAGLQRVEKRGGNFVVWGGTVPALDPAWYFTQHRELMSHYGVTLGESFDWIIYAINDPDTQELALSALASFFLPEWRKRALRGDKFEDACQIKIDAENNTDATRALGDMHADTRLRLADTTERFIIGLSKSGVSLTKEV